MNRSVGGLRFGPVADLSARSAWLQQGAAYDEGTDSVALSEIDRNLLQRCLDAKPRAWEDFVDRFMGLIVHVINHTAQSRSVRLRPEDRDDLCAEVFLTIVKDDLALLRRFRGESSLATYLTVVARRIVVRAMLDQKAAARLENGAVAGPPQEPLDSQPAVEDRLESRDEVDRLLAGLADQEAEVVKLYHLEGKSYQEISSSVGMPMNSIGPILSRARQKMRGASVSQPAG
ncbi:MAG: sigma-70 family RNA polymerase sigma factor [Patescibacteria group bacterium]|nr:sigma-70 family RNA polymerase sigma factor [Patescibacteria group bacterium]